MIIVPESVIDYHRDAHIRAAVDSLLAGRRGTVPGDLSWEELGRFYDAVAAARRVQSDFAQFLNDLWRATWQGVPGWKALPPGAPERSDMSVLVDNVWEWRCFTRGFKRDQRTLELSVSLDEDSVLQLGVALLDSRGRNILASAGLAGWQEEKSGGYLWTSHEITSLQSEIDAAHFAKWVKQALAAVQPVNR